MNSSLHVSFDLPSLWNGRNPLLDFLQQLCKLDKVDFRETNVGSQVASRYHVLNNASDCKIKTFMSYDCANAPQCFAVNSMMSRRADYSQVVEIDVLASLPSWNVSSSRALRPPFHMISCLYIQLWVLGKFLSSGSLCTAIWLWQSLRDASTNTHFTSCPHAFMSSSASLNGDFELSHFTKITVIMVKPVY